MITKINVTADGGNKTYAAVVDENNSITLVEDTAVEYVYKAEDADYPAFAAEKTVGNITIHVSAEKGVLPKGTQLSVKEIATQDDKVEEAVAEKEDTVAEKVSAVAVFDITLLDKDGKEIEPASGKNVSVTFTNIKTADKKNVETKVFRMTDELDTVAKTMSADVDHQKKEVSFDTDHFTAYAIADINGSPTGSQPVSNLITSVTLNTTANPPVALDHNGSMKFNTAYLVKYNIKSPIYFGKANADLGPSGTDNYYVTPGSTYILPNLPAQIKLANGLNDFDVYTDNNLKFGKIHPTLNQDGSTKLELTIDSGISAAYLENAYAGMNIKLDETVILNSETSSIAWDANNSSYTVTIEDNKKVAPTMVKTGLYDSENNKINWTVTVTNPVNVKKYGSDGTQGTLDFIDTLSDNQSFTGTDVFKDNDVEKQNDNIFSLSNENRTIKYSYKYNLGESSTRTFKYTTTPDADAVKSIINNKELPQTDGNIKFTNSAKLQDGTNVVASCTSVEVNHSVKTYTMTKDGKYNDDGTITWTITVIDEGGWNFKNVKVYDQFDDTKLELVSNSVSAKVKGVDAGDVSGNVLTTGGTDSRNSQAYNWTYNIGDLNSTNAPYVIKYTTKIKNFETSNIDSETNKAWLSFDWAYSGNGTGIETGLGTPGIDKTVSGIKHSIIRKDLVAAFDYQTYEIKWKITVNECKYNGFTDNAEVIKDNIPDDLVYTGIEDFKVNDEDKTATEYFSSIPLAQTQAGKDVEFAFRSKDKINGNKISFTVITKLADTKMSYLSDNSQHSFRNWAELWDNTKLDSDYEDTSFTPNALKKEFLKYDYSNHTIKWKLTVNSNKEKMTGIVITDTLPTGFTLVDSNPITTDEAGTSSIVNGAKNNIAASYTFDENTRLLTVYLLDITDEEK